MSNKASAEYQEQNIMPLARKDGCRCEFSRDKYEQGDWLHDADCPAQYIECLPNAGRLLEALRAGK